MVNIKQAAKSKTINFNVWSPIILAILTATGVTIPVELIAGGMALANIILRAVTKQPLSEK